MDSRQNSTSRPIPHQGGGGCRVQQSGKIVGRLGEEVFEKFGGRTRQADGLSPSTSGASGPVQPPESKTLESFNVAPIEDSDPDHAVRTSKSAKKKADEQPGVTKRSEMKGKKDEQKDQLKKNASEKRRASAKEKKEGKEKKSEPTDLEVKKVALDVKRKVSKKENKEMKRRGVLGAKEAERPKASAQKEKHVEASKSDPAAPKKTAIAGVSGKGEGAMYHGEEYLGVTDTSESGGTTSRVSYACIAGRGTGRRESMERLEPPFVPKGTLLTSNQAVLLTYQKDTWALMAPKELSQLHVVQNGGLYYVCLTMKRVCKQLQLCPGLVVKQVSPEHFTLSNGISKFGMIFANTKEANGFMDMVEGIIRRVESDKMLSSRMVHISTKNRYGGLRVDPDMVVKEVKDGVVHPDKGSSHMESSKKEKKEARIDMSKFLNLPNMAIPPRKWKNDPKSTGSAEGCAKKTEEEPGPRSTPKKKIGFEGCLKSSMSTPEQEHLKVGKMTKVTSEEPRNLEKASWSSEAKRNQGGGRKSRSSGAEEMESKDSMKQTSAKELEESRDECCLSRADVLMWSKDKKSGKWARVGAKVIVRLLRRHNEFRVVANDEDQKQSKEMTVLLIQADTKYDLSLLPYHKWTNVDGSEWTVKFPHGSGTFGSDFGNSVQMAIDFISMTEQKKTQVKKAIRIASPTDESDSSEISDGSDEEVVQLEGKKKLEERRPAMETTVKDEADLKNMSPSALQSSSIQMQNEKRPSVSVKKSVIIKTQAIIPAIDEKSSDVLDDSELEMTRGISKLSQPGDGDCMKNGGSRKDSRVTGVEKGGSSSSVHAVGISVARMGSTRSSVLFQAKPSGQKPRGYLKPKKERAILLKSSYTTDNGDEDCMTDDVFLDNDIDIRSRAEQRMAKPRTYSLRPSVASHFRYSVRSSIPETHCTDHFRLVRIGRKMMIIPKRKCKCGWLRGLHCPRVTRIRRKLGLSLADFDYYVWNGKILPTIVGGAGGLGEARKELEARFNVGLQELERRQEDLPSNRAQMLSDLRQRCLDLEFKRSFPLKFPDDVEFSRWLIRQMWEYVWAKFEVMLAVDLMDLMFWLEFLRNRPQIHIHSPYLLQAVMNRDLLKDLWQVTFLEAGIKLGLMEHLGISVSMEQHQQILGENKFWVHLSPEGYILEHGVREDDGMSLASSKNTEADGDFDDMEEDDEAIETVRAGLVARSPIDAGSPMASPTEPSAPKRRRVDSGSSSTLPPPQPLSPSPSTSLPSSSEPSRDEKKKPLPMAEKFPRNDVEEMIMFLARYIEERENGEKKRVRNSKKKDTDLYISGGKIWEAFVKECNPAYRNPKAWMRHFNGTVADRLYTYNVPADKILEIYKKLKISISAIKDKIERALKVRINEQDGKAVSWVFDAPTFVAVLPDNNDEHKEKMDEAVAAGPYQLYMPEFEHRHDTLEELGLYNGEEDE